MEENLGSRPGLLLTSHLALDKSLNLSDPQFSHLENYSSLTGLVWRPNKKIHDKQNATCTFIYISVHSIVFAEAALWLQERETHFAASWAQSLWKQESEAFSQVRWTVVDSASLFPSPSFLSLLSTHLRVRNRFYFSSKIQFFDGNFQASPEGRKEGGGQKPTFLQHFSQQPHFLPTVEVNFLWIMDDSLMNMHTAYYACEVW